jgi:hypothetical protein
MLSDSRATDAGEIFEVDLSRESGATLAAAE